MKTDKEKIVLSFIKQYKMAEKGEKITAALSGGADSVCLLLMLNNLKEKLGIKLQAVHINHHLRGEESMRDENFCRELCQKYGIKLDVYDVDVEKREKEFSESCEEAARNLRYEIFSKYEKISTAHTASDNLETSIYNYMRGSGLSGIAGIPPVRDGKIIRPLLMLSRNDIEEYLFEKGESYVTDSTNLTDDYSRNRIRHNLVPLMKEWNGSIEKTSSYNLEVLRTDLDFINSESEKIFDECFEDNKLKGLKKCHSAIRQRCILKYLKVNNFSYDFERIRQIEKNLLENGKTEVTTDTYIMCKNDIIYIEKKENFSVEEKQVKLQLGNNSIFEGYNMEVNLVKDENTVKMLMFNKNLTKNILDCDKIKGEPILRNRRYGDKIIPYNRNFHISVKKWLQSNVPEDKKKFIHFIEDDDGLIFVEGIGAEKRVKCDSGTKNILLVSVKKTEKKKMQKQE